ncbi:dimethyladenosine transferase 1, mitochondrial [Cephus cinctus]|uniref:rRNA adenine N(6)-methyltransferase n=1 Tax=Cephus cinctus TaxID=211228 RepID=A0AAJ7FEL0_CEPCN|nr:dimethyladenosine transferase 1, mitochondrial [Cephus cinctus]
MSGLRLPPLPTIRDLVKLYRLRAIKQLSQNFLMDERLSDKIVKMAGRLEDAHIVEVGPGPGGLTRAIIRRCPKKLIVIEKDNRFMPSLQLLADAFAGIGGQMEILIDDIMSTSMSNTFPCEVHRNWDDRCPNIHLIGNLPFSISTALIIQWLKAISERNDAWAIGRVRMTLTFQKEVAERLVAQASEPQRCRLSLMAQAWTKPSLRFVIPGRAFVPKPKVDVGVVTFTPLIEPRTVHNFTLFEKMARHLFSFRQKYSVKCVGTLFPKDCREEFSSLMFKLCDLHPTVRPYQLTVEDVNRLCTAYKYLCEKHPELEGYNYRASHNVLPQNQTLNLRVREFSDA